MIDIFFSNLDPISFNLCYKSSFSSHDDDDDDDDHFGLVVKRTGK